MFGKPLLNSAEKGPKEDLPRLQDDRDLGKWESAYPFWAKFWIYVELSYLLALLFVSLCFLAQCSVSQLPVQSQALLIFLPMWIPRELDQQAYAWTAILAAGVAGGTAAALKWHYHCVAKKLWHADRRVWRITSPLLSGVLALFVMMLIKSNILPIFRPELLNQFISASSIAFLLGLFSDNLLAALQNFASSSLGTLKDTKRKDDASPSAGE